MNNQIRLAILGCGTIVKSQHLPAALAHPDVVLVALVDAASNRAAMRLPMLPRPIKPSLVLFGVKEFISAPPQKTLWTI